MPPKMTIEPLKIFIRNNEDGRYFEMTNVKSIDLEELADSQGMYNAEKMFWDMPSVSLTFKIISNSNNRRMHGKRPFRMRCYHRWKRYEIYRRYLD